MKKRKILRREGYWSNTNDVDVLPYPRQAWTERPGQKKFLKALNEVEGCDEVEVNAYKGSSPCRICGIKNGSTDFTYKGWRWPSGFRHYVEKHNVRPSLAFQEFIISTYVE